MCSYTQLCRIVWDPIYRSLEKAMATHSSTLAWKIPWTEEPGRLQSTGSLGVGHDWATSLSLFTFMHWRRKWQPTSVFLPGESQGWQSLVGCHLWDRTELDKTEVTWHLAARNWLSHLSMGFSGENTGVEYHSLLQGIFPTQGLNPHFLYLLHWQVDSCHENHLHFWLCQSLWLCGPQQTV